MHPGMPVVSSKPWWLTTSTSAARTTPVIIFNRRVRRDTPGTFRTAIDRRDNGGVIVNVFYKHSRIKQYLKDGRAMRIETVINSPRDLGCQARLPNLDELQTKGRACNQRILHAQAGRPGLCPCEPSL